MESLNLEDIFVNASQLDERKIVFLREVEQRERRALSGAKYFKRKAMGLCGSSTVKSLEEMARLLYETRIAPSIEDGKELAPELVGKRIQYGGFLSCSSLGFEIVKNSKEEEVYKITAYSPLIP